MSGGHTPGPWSYGHTMGDRLWVGPAYDKAPVALVDWDSADARSESRANACVIAAAPDLLEALQAMVRTFVPFPREDTEGWREEHEACQEAYAAIAKATGK